VKALVLAGGLGTRMRPFTFSMPKQLFPIANEPVLVHVLKGIRDIGVTEICVIVGDRSAEIIEAIGDGSRFGVRITYVHQAAPLGLAHCVRLARTFLGSDDFVMYLGDNILPAGIGKIAKDFRNERPAAQIAIRKVPNPTEFGVVELAGGGNVQRLVEKPKEPRSDLAIIGVYFFTPEIHEAVRAIRPSARGELEITDAIQWLLRRGAAVRATEYDGYWKDVGRVEDVLECNRQLLGDTTRKVSGHVDAVSELVGDVVVEEGARVVRSRIDGPAIIGAGTLIEDSLIESGTAIGRDCTVRAARLSDSIVLDGASISSGPRLRASLIGRSAIVGCGGADHCLVVGDQTRIEFAA
jgi:glucose-1-phosphate thymidylyltransferase